MDKRLLNTGLALLRERVDKFVFAGRLLVLIHNIDHFIELQSLLKPVSGIAFDTGFNHVSWFYRALKHRFGLTSGEAQIIATPV